MRAAQALVQLLGRRNHFALSTLVSRLNRFSAAFPKVDLHRIKVCTWPDHQTPIGMSEKAKPTTQGISPRSSGRSSIAHEAAHEAAHESALLCVAEGNRWICVEYTAICSYEQVLPSSQNPLPKAQIREVRPRWRVVQFGRKQGRTLTGVNWRAQRMAHQRPPGFAVTPAACRNAAKTTTGNRGAPDQAVGSSEWLCGSLQSRKLLQRCIS